MSDSTTACYRGVSVEDEDGDTLTRGGVIGFVRKFADILAKRFPQVERDAITIYHRNGTFSIKLPAEDSIVGWHGERCCSLRTLTAIVAAAEAAAGGVADSEIEIVLVDDR